MKKEKKEAKFEHISVLQALMGINAKHGGPFGAVIVKDGKIVGRGHNKVLKKHDPTAHGEIVAIRNACKELKTHDLSGCVLYTSSYPCPMCLSAIIWANIKEVHYGNTAKDAAEIGFRDDFMYDYLKDMDNDSLIKFVPYSEDGQKEAKQSFQDYMDMEHQLY